MVVLQQGKIDILAFIELRAYLGFVTAKVDERRKNEIVPTST